LGEVIEDAGEGGGFTAAEVEAAGGGVRGEAEELVTGEVGEAEGAAEGVVTLEMGGTAGIFVEDHAGWTVSKKTERAKARTTNGEGLLRTHEGSSGAWRGRMGLFLRALMSLWMS